MQHPETTVIDEIVRVKGVAFPADIRLRKLLITGPPGCGKSSIINKVGGWSEEGYIDMGISKWWTSQSLAVRPREIHLGIPFAGHDKSLAVFDPKWRQASPPLALDLKRIKLPPAKRNALSVDWFGRYVFEFLLPAAEDIFRWRCERAKRGTHHVDSEITLELVQRQVDTFYQLAHYLHLKGLNLYVRQGLDGQLLRFSDAAQSVDPGRERQSHSGFTDILRDVLGTRPNPRDIQLDEPILLQSESVRLNTGIRITLHLGGEECRLQLLPETGIDGRITTSPPDYLVRLPDQPPGRIGGFLRLRQGEQLVLGRTDPLQQVMFEYPSWVEKKHLEIRYESNALLLRDLSKEPGTRLLPLPADELQGGQRRLNLLQELKTIFGGPIQTLPADAALYTLKQVNALLEHEPMRERDKLDQPGGVVRLPDRMTPIIIGDTHAQVDNLLTLLTQNEFMEALGDGTAVMLFLGDAVHKEVDGEMEEMQSSLLMMDLIFRLKLWFPQQVYYIRGNHDCFLEDVGKDGVPQGLLWEREVRKSRGEEYKQEMDRFYELVPYVALSSDFVACHAAPPKSKVDMELLVNARQYPGLIQELICNRIYAPNRPSGYTKGDVKRLRKALGLGKEADLFVGHTPLDRSETLWTDIAGIPNHHVVFSGNIPWIGVFTRIDGHFIPLRYRREPLLPLINALPAGYRETIGNTREITPSLSPQNLHPQT